MRKITVYDQVALIALAGESMVCYIGLHNVVQLDVIASLLGLVFNSSVLFFLYCHSFRRVLTGSIKPNETVNHPFPNDDNHIIIYKEREERELKTIDAVFNYTMHYIGQYLSQDERTLIRENIIIFSFDKDEELHPVMQDKFDDFNLYDITHLCHAIGNHSLPTPRGSMYIPLLPNSPIPTVSPPFPFCIETTLCPILVKRGRFSPADSG